MKRLMIYAGIVAALLLLPTAIAKFRYPATLKSVTSQDGQLVAEICWMPASSGIFASWFDVLAPTYTRMFAVVRRPGEEPLFSMPLDLVNDVPQDYAGAAIAWKGDEVVFASIRGVEARIDVGRGNVQTRNLP